MTRKAFHSRMGAQLVAARERRGEFTASATVESLSVERRVELLQEEGVWNDVARHFRIVRVRGQFYDAEGAII